MSEQEGGSGDAIGVGETLTFGLQGGCWCWGEVEDVDDDTLTLRSIRVTDDLATPPGRGGKLASGGRATIRRDAIVAVVDGTFTSESGSRTMAKLYGDVFKDDGDELDPIQKARKTVEEKARERLEKGLDDTIQQAKVVVYRNNPALVDQLLGTPPPEPEERTRESSPARREVEDEVMEQAAILVDKTPGLTMAQAAIRVLQRDEQLAEKYLHN